MLADLSSQDTPTVDRAEPPDPAHRATEVGEGTCALLAKVLFQQPLAAQLLDAYLKDRGRDTEREWKLVIDRAVLVPDDGAPGPA